MSEKKNEFNYITRKGYKYPAKHCSMYNYDYLKFDFAKKRTYEMALSPTIDIFQYRRDILNNSYLPKNISYEEWSDKWNVGRSEKKNVSNDD